MLRRDVAPDKKQILKSQCPSTFTIQSHCRKNFWELQRILKKIVKFFFVRIAEDVCENIIAHVLCNSQTCRTWHKILKIKNSQSPKYTYCVYIKVTITIQGSFFLKKRDSLRIRTWAQARSLARARARAESVADTNSRKSLQVYFYSLYFFKKFNKNKNIKAPQCAVKIWIFPSIGWHKLSKFSALWNLLHKVTV